MEHVVYCDRKEKELDKIINSKQSMIIRATQTRRIPHSRVFKGEKLYFTVKDSNVIEYIAEVKEVYNYSQLFKQETNKILMKFKDLLNIPFDSLEKYQKKCLCLIEFENFKSCDQIQIRPQASLVDWIILNDINDIVQKDK